MDPIVPQPSTPLTPEEAAPLPTPTAVAAPPSAARKPRPWAVGLALAAIFGCGVLVGCLGTLGALQKLVFPHEMNPERWNGIIVKRLDQELKLSPPQHEAIVPLVRAGTMGAAEARRRAGGEMLAIFERTHQQVAEQLNPDQRRTLDELIARRRHQARRWFRPSHPPREHPRGGVAPGGAPTPGPN